MASCHPVAPGNNKSVLNWTQVCQLQLKNPIAQKCVDSLDIPVTAMDKSYKNIVNFCKFSTSFFKKRI
jgi:hypothetical protein